MRESTPFLGSHLDLGIDVKQHCHDHSSLGRLVLQSEVARRLSPPFGPADWIQPFIAKVAVALLRIRPSYVAILTGLCGSENVVVGEGEDRNALRYKPHKHLPYITDKLTRRSKILALPFLLPREAQEHGNIILSPWYTEETKLKGLARRKTASGGANALLPAEFRGTNKSFCIEAGAAIAKAY